MKKWQSWEQFPNHLCYYKSVKNKMLCFPCAFLFVFCLQLWGHPCPAFQTLVSGGYPGGSVPS